VPELPEVETTVKDLNKLVLGQKIEDVWSDSYKIIKHPKNFNNFKEEIKGKEIKKIWRRGKNIIFDLSENKYLLVHQKLTGHLLYGKWKFINGKWIPPEGSLSEKINTYIHLVFVFKNGNMMALSDLRKFAKIGLFDRKELEKELNNLGPEPLDKKFTFEKFKKAISQRTGKIKQVLMDQEIIAGIGNIYSDEILWEAKIHPLRNISQINERELKKIYIAMKKILNKAIKLRGESFSDYRDPKGEKGFFDKERKVYHREKEKCFRCGNIIKRLKIGGRSAHFCPICQPFI
jgi:formamidopyrimidine-DNA glycosylase